MKHFCTILGFGDDSGDGRGHPQNPLEISATFFTRRGLCPRQSPLIPANPVNFTIPVLAISSTRFGNHGTYPIVILGRLI